MQHNQCAATEKGYLTTCPPSRAPFSRFVPAPTLQTVCARKWTRRKMNGEGCEGLRSHSLALVRPSATLALCVLYLGTLRLMSER